MKTGFLVLTSLCLTLGLSASASADRGPASTLPSANPGPGWTYALFAGQGLVSDSCYYHLDMQADGNLVVYAGPGNAASQHTWDNGLAGHVESYTVLQSDGNLVEYQIVNGGLTALWSTGSARGTLSTLWMQNDGNLVLYPATSPGANDWWASNTVTGDISGPSSCSMQSTLTRMDSNKAFEYTQVLESFCDDGSKTGGGQASCGNECALRGASCSGWTYYPNAASSYPSGSGSCESTGACYMFTGSIGDESTFSGAVSGWIEHSTP